MAVVPALPAQRNPTKSGVNGANRPHQPKLKALARPTASGGVAHASTSHSPRFESRNAEVTPTRPSATPTDNTTVDAQRRACPDSQTLPRDHPRPSLSDCPHQVTFGWVSMTTSIMIGRLVRPGLALWQAQAVGVRRECPHSPLRWRFWRSRSPPVPTLGRLHRRT